MLRKKVTTSVRDIWAMIGISLVMLVAIELFFSLAFYFQDFRNPPAPDFRLKADTYTDPIWVAKYYKELDEVEHKRSIRWKPYVYWRRMSRQGEYININSEGLRQTTNIAPSKEQGSSKKVFVFGGSTIWGLGASDSLTIPSIFAKEVNDKGINCEVVNYGQYAYVSTQEVIDLMLQLQKGNIPDAVIFYDGVNDTFGAFQQSVPGLPHSEFKRDQEFALIDRPELRTFAIQAEIAKLSTVRFLNGTLKRFGLKKDSIQSLPLEFEKPISDKKALARSVVETYLNNIKLVQALSKTYGFKCLFYWQPMIYLKQQLTEYEQTSLGFHFNYPGMKEFYLDTYAAMQQSGAGMKDDTSFHDISLMFRDVREPIYIDFNHMGEKGNRPIAQRMASDFVKLFPPQEIKNHSAEY